MAESEPWYRRYFGEDYLRIYRLADTAEQLEFLQRRLGGLPRGSRVLDLPCGHGRHATELARWGLSVTGADLSETFLHHAADTAAQAGVSLALLRADMRVFPLASSSFDAAICMFTSLGYFATDAEHQAVLDQFARVLKPGAPFVLDLANIDAVRIQASSSAWERNGVRVESLYEWHEPTKRAVTRRVATFADGRREHYDSDVRLFEGVEIEAMLARAGLALREQLGAYSGGSVAPERPRRILCCEREAAA